MTMEAAATTGSTVRCGLAPCPPPQHPDDDEFDRRHGGAIDEAECACGHARPVVQPVDRIDGEAFEQPLVDHALRTRAILLGGLEDQPNGAEITGARQFLGCGEQDGRVPVMAAGMHLASHFAGMGQPGRLGDRQRVHVGADGDAACCPDRRRGWRRRRCHRCPLPHRSPSRAALRRPARPVSCSP